MSEAISAPFWSLAPLVLVLDREGRVLFWNQICTRATGYQLEEVQGRNVFELLGADPEAAKSAFEQVKSGQVPASTEGYLVSKSGERHWFTWSADVARSREGAVDYVVLTGIDRSRAKAAEEELRISEAKYAGIVSIASDAIISVDEAQRITIYNEGAEAIFGWSREEVLGKPLDLLIPDRFKVIHREHVERFGTEAVKARNMGQRRPAIFGLRKSGEEFPAAAAISKLEVGGRRLFTVVLRDISAQKRMEMENAFLSRVGAVLASTLDYEITLTKIGELSVQFLCDCCFIYLAEEGTETVRRWKVLIRDPEKRGLANSLEKAQFDPKWKDLQRVLETGVPLLIPEVTEENLQSAAQNEEHLALLRELGPVSYIGLPLLAQGRIVGAIALISTDPRHLYGEQDLQLGMELASRAGLAIENARLYQVAQQAVLVRDDVMRIAAHDLRSPLSAALLAVGSILRKQQRSGSLSPSRKMLEMIGRSLERANRLIQDLLEVSRIESGRLTLEKAPLSTRELMLEVMEVLTPLAIQAGIELEAQLPAELPAVVGDRGRIFQVFANLVDNALKFTPRGGKVRLGAAMQSDGSLKFWVSDTGPGISAENAAHLFERYWQAQAGSQGGIGFGLFICKGIVEAHGGKIGVESVPGQGCTFYFTLPNALSAVPSPAAKEGWDEGGATHP